jgi:CheY-like chemotaxis protein
LETEVEYQPNVLLLDIGLPATDGYEVARRLRQYLELKKTRLITTTGYGEKPIANSRSMRASNITKSSQ